MEPSDLSFSVSVAIRHYTDGVTYVALSGHEAGEPWTCVCPSYSNTEDGLCQAIDDVARILVAWSEVGPLGVAGAVSAIRGRQS